MILGTGILYIDANVVNSLYIIYTFFLVPVRWLVVF